MAKHHEVYGRPIQDWFLRQEILPALESASLITEEEDPNDKRKKIIHITTPPFNSLYLSSNLKKYSEYNSGVWQNGICEYCGENNEVMKFKGRFICKTCIIYETQN